MKINRASRVLDNKEEIIRRVEQGEELRTIAPDFNVTPAAISNKLAKDQDYRVARVAGLEDRLEQRIVELEQATDQLGVSRARELVKLAQWKLERLVSEVYGNQPKIAIQVNTVPTTQLLEDDLKDIIEGKAVKG